MLKRLLRSAEPDVTQLLQRRDLPGLVRALQDKSLEVVTHAAHAIASFHSQGDEAERLQAAATAPALVDAYDRVSREVSIYKNMAAHALIDALGEIRASEATNRLMLVASNKTHHDSVDRAVAMKALARISGPAIGPWFVSLLDDLDSGQAASFALVELGDEGLSLLREYLLRPERLAASRSRGDAGNALQKTVLFGSAHAAAAEAILAEVDAAEHEAERQRVKEHETLAALRQAEEREAEIRDRQREELAARLASRIGSAAWVLPGGTIHPSTRAQYEAALARCRRFGFPVHEMELPESNEVSDFWAEVEFEGEVVTIEGGRGFRDVMP